MSEFESPTIEEFTLSNIPIDEASKLIGIATSNPNIRIRCDVFEFCSNKQFFSKEISPYAAAAKDDQESLRVLTNAMSRGGTEFVSLTTFRRFIP